MITFELIVDDCFVLCVGIAVSVQETVKSRLRYQGLPTYLPAQRTARERKHTFGV